jgi:hypothetical protein
MTTCDVCKRSDGLHESWGAGGDTIETVRCAGVFSDDLKPGRVMHCPNTAPIGGGGYCGPCHWAARTNFTISETEQAMETLRPGDNST